MSGPAVADRAVVDHFLLDVPGEPRGQGRPRIDTRGRRPRTFTDDKTTSAAHRIQSEWIAAGRPVLTPGPYRMVVTAHLGRPKGHYRADGRSLSAAGDRSPMPTRKPDLTNVAKLIEDALVGVQAIPDDAACVEVVAMKVWAERSIAGPRVEVRVESLAGWPS